MVKAIHNLNRGINFNSQRDEYVSCWFRTSKRDLRREEVQPMVGGWGTVPLSLKETEDGLWQSNFKLPPGLDPGFHELRVRTGQSAFSNPVRLAVDLPARAAAIEITGVCDGRTWEPGVIRLTPDGVLSTWVRGLPENADLNNMEVVLGDRRLSINHMSPPEPQKGIQINADVPARLPAGEYAVQVTLSLARSNSVRVTILDKLP